MNYEITDRLRKIIAIRTRILDIEQRIEYYIFSKFIGEIIDVFNRLGFQTNALSFNVSLSRNPTNFIKKKNISETIVFTSYLTKEDCSEVIRHYGSFSKWLSAYKRFKEVSKFNKIFDLCDDDFYDSAISETTEPEEYILKFINILSECFSTFLTDLYLDSGDPMKLMDWITMTRDYFDINLDNYIPRISLKHTRYYNTSNSK